MREDIKCCNSELYEDKRPVLDYNTIEEERGDI